MEDDGLGPLVAGAQEELGFAAAADGLLTRLRVSAAGRLQELVDLRRKQLRLSRSRRSMTTEQEERVYSPCRCSRDTHSAERCHHKE